MEESRNKPLTVYISHSACDAPLAQWVADGLVGAGVTPQLDEIEIKAGDNAISWMSDAVGESDHLLVLLGPELAEQFSVESEWLDALLKEGYLRRAFVIPVLLPQLADSQVPDILGSIMCEDLRGEHPEKSLMHFIARLKDDLLVERELGRRPSPATRNMVEHVAQRFPNPERPVQIVLHSNRFKRCFRIAIDAQATGHYFVEMLRDTLHLRLSDTDEDLGIELSYGYYLKHHGVIVQLDTTFDKAGVKNGDYVELWIRVTVRDLLQDKDVGEEVFKRIYGKSIEELSDEQLQARKRALSSAEIARMASELFKHVDE